MSGGHSTYVPKTGIGRWFDGRLPVPRLLHDQFIVYPVPRNLNYAYSFGGILSMHAVVGRDRDAPPAAELDNRSDPGKRQGIMPKDVAQR
jgi:hypothetical protein